MQTVEGQAAPYRQPVPPVVADDRPYWSVMIPTYNCAAFLGETLRSVLAQDPGPERMQIEVVDDGSSDDPGAMVREIAGSRVGFYRQRENVGHIRNFQSCLERSHGRIVHMLHGDDAVAPGFYEALEAGFVARPEIGAAFCRTVYMDENGRRIGQSETVLEQAGLVPSAAETLARTQVIMTPSIAVRRVVYERLGGFDSRLVCSEDWEMWVRIAASYPIWHDPEPLALYRMHADSNTGRHLRSARDMAFSRIAIDMFAAYLPDESRKRVVADAKHTYALSCLDRAKTLGRQGHSDGMRAHLREAMLFEPSIHMMIRAASIYVRGMAWRP
jgi:glycosyltransferase involved in cell wall biosynthesis